MPKISFKLNTSSLNAAIEELNAYKESIEFSTNVLRHTIADDLAQMIEDGFGESPYNKLTGGTESRADVAVSTVKGDDGVDKVLAKGHEAVFVEFGAGITFNGQAGSSPHPSGPLNNFYIGTYGHGYGSQPLWMFTDEAGQPVYTYGTPASMPMYKSAQEIKKKVPEYAKYAFGLGKGK